MFHEPGDAMADNKVLGAAGEEIAARVLTDAGFRIVERNFVFVDS